MRELRALVARASWTDLLPARGAGALASRTGPPSCLDALPLGRDRWLAMVADEVGRTFPVPLVLGADAVRRARPGDGAAEGLLSVIAAGTRELGAFAVTCRHTEPASGERAVGVDQTHESVVIGERAVLKWRVLAEAGPHPAPRLLDELEGRHFTGMPRPWATLTWRPVTGAARLVASVDALLPGAVDGWTWAVDDLRAAVVGADEAPVRAVGHALGDLVAAFHTALAPTARTATPAETRRWRPDADADLDQALRHTTGRAHDVLAEHAAAVRAVWAGLPRHIEGPVMRVHGDLHVGQVLRSAGDPVPTYLVTDFDGNPVLAAEDRLREQPAALDVAGMLQSLRHVALVLRRHDPGQDPATTERMSRALCREFLETYRARLARASLAALLDERLLDAYSLRQVCREFSYAAVHLPRWSYVPEAALPALLAVRR